MLKQQKVYFGPDEINAFYGFDDNAIGHTIFKNPTWQDMKDVLEGIACPNTKWYRTPTEKYQFFLHNLNTEASVWLLFVKKKIMSTRHHI